jgi:GH24 family phage-related lysozyme (muramidase)
MISWANGYLPDSTLKAIQDDLRLFEGSIPFMYLDTVSTVTIGVGTALFSASDTDSIKMVDANGATASTTAKRAAWKVVQDVSSPRGTKQNAGANSFKTLTTLTILDDERDRLLNAKIQEFYLDLVDIYPGFDSMPEPAKISLFDMIYNLGSGGIEYKFPHFTKAVRARGWKTAADQSRRPQLSDRRNNATKNRFLECASNAPSPAQPQKQQKLNLSKTSSSKPQKPLPKPASFSPPPFYKPIPHPDRIIHSPLIKLGDKGPDVSVAQNALNRLLVGQRPLLRVDGVFGLHVAQAVKFVQHHAGIPADGQIGSRTRPVLDLLLT